MNVSETLRFLEAFRGFGAQVFNSFPDFPGYSSEKNKYVVFVKASSLASDDLCKLEEFARRNHLRITRFGHQHLMVDDRA